MGMNKSTGNMYPWIHYTWNPVKGCLHMCTYCYVYELAKRYGYSTKPRFDAKEMKTNLGTGNTEFVGSTSDMWGSWVPADWIEQVLDHCSKYNNTYLFQSKNPARFLEFSDKLRSLDSVILGTTLESDIDYNISYAPIPEDRAHYMEELSKMGFETMVSIEPIMKFDPINFVRLIKQINPKFVSVGADSKKHGLVEPDAASIQCLIDELRKFTQVKIKSNLRRLK